MSNLMMCTYSNIVFQQYTVVLPKSQTTRESNCLRPFCPNFEVIAPDVYVILSTSCVELFKMVSYIKLVFYEFP